MCTRVAAQLISVVPQPELSELPVRALLDFYFCIATALMPQSPVRFAVAVVPGNQDCKYCQWCHLFLWCRVAYTAESHMERAIVAALAKSKGRRFDVRLLLPIVADLS